MYLVKVNISHSQIAIGAVGLETCVQQMKGGAHSSLLAVLFFPNSKKIPIYCWVDRKCFPVVQ